MRKRLLALRRSVSRNFDANVPCVEDCDRIGDMTSTRHVSNGDQLLASLEVGRLFAYS